MNGKSLAKSATDSEPGCPKTNPLKMARGAGPKSPRGSGTPTQEKTKMNEAIQAVLVRNGFRVEGTLVCNWNTRKVTRSEIETALDAAGIPEVTITRASRGMAITTEIEHV